MRHVAWVLASALLTVSALSLQAVAMPGPAFACSCPGPPPPLAEIVVEGDVAVVIGVPGQPLGEVTPLATEAWYFGNDLADTIWLRGGTGMLSSCDVFLTTGQPYLLVLERDATDGVYATNSCAPSAQIGTAEGDVLVAEAEEAFGAPQSPPAPAPEPDALPDPSPWLGGGLVWVFAGVGAAAVLFVGALVIAVRRQRR